VLIKRVGPVDMLHLMVWARLIPPLPALVMSAFLDGLSAFVDAVATAAWPALLAPVYLGLVASVFTYAARRGGRCFSVTRREPLHPLHCWRHVSAVVFCEKFSNAQVVGMGLLLVGVVVVALPRWLR
jgi:O-acetylserine/cysteine efflux transporter